MAAIVVSRSFKRNALSSASIVSSEYSVKLSSTAFA